MTLKPHMGNISDRQEKMRHRLTLNGLFYAAISSASFGFSPLFSLSLIAAGLTHFDILSYRWMTAAAVLVIYAAVKRKTLRFTSKGELWKTILLSALRAITSITLLIGYANIASSIAATINFMYPVIVTLCMMIFFGEKKSWISIGAVLLSVLGVYMMAAGDGLRVEGGDTTLGLVCSIVSAISFAAYYIIMKRTKADKIEAVKFTTWIMLLSGIYFIAGGLLVDGHITIVTSGKSWGYILGLGLWATMVSNFTGVKAIRRIGPTLTSILGALQPVTAVILGALFLDEHLSVESIGGIALILIAVIVIVLNQKPKKH